MPRSANPVPQYFTSENKILSGGLMFYFEVGTSDPKETYSDQGETIPNTHPVVLDSEGRLPNVFFTGTARQVLSDSNSVQIWARDDVGFGLQGSAGAITVIDIDTNALTTNGDDDGFLYNISDITGSVTVTVDSVLTDEIGTMVFIRSNTNSTVSIVAGGGVTIETAYTLDLFSKFSTVAILYLSETTATLMGDLEQ